MTEHLRRPITIFILFLIIAIAFILFPLFHYLTGEKQPDRELIALMGKWNRLQASGFTFLYSESPSEEYASFYAEQSVFSYELFRLMEGSEAATFWTAIQDGLFREFQYYVSRFPDTDPSFIEKLRRDSSESFPRFGALLAREASSLSTVYKQNRETVRRSIILLELISFLLLVLLSYLLYTLFSFQRLQNGVLYHYADPLFILGKRGETVYANPAAEELAGGKSRGKGLEQLLTLEKSDDHPGQELLDHRGVMLPLMHQEHPIYSFFGKRIGTAHSFRDMSEWNDLVSQARKREELELIAKLSASFAHEFNNSLAAISGRIQLARISEPSQFETYLDEAKELLLSASEQTRQLVSLGMGAEEGSPRRSLSGCVYSAVQTVFHASPLSCRIAMQDGLGDAELADGRALQIILVQLLQNALEATLSANRRGSGIQLSLLQRSDHHGFVDLMIDDSGDGIEADQVQKLFKPFYTEKWNHKGLGLSFSRLLAERAGGTVHLYPRKEGGCRALLRYPVIGL